MFLVTTALKETINNDKENLFLGEWCDIETNQQKMDYIWSDKKKVSSAYSQCMKHYDYFLPILTKYLNKEHKLDKDIHFYKIIFGNWLLQYIHIYYDRYINIIKFSKEYGEFETYLMNESDYYVPFSHHEFILLSSGDDNYNFQIYSNIIKILFGKKKFRIIYLSNPIKKSKEIRKKNTILKKIFFNFNKLLGKRYKKNYLISDNYFGENQMLKMLKVLVRSKFKVIFNDFNFGGEFKRKIDFSKRAVALDIQTSSVFRKIISKTIIKDLPEIYIESFSDFNLYVKKNFSANIDSFYTPLSLQFNDEIKFFLAENYKNINIFAQQHGSGYGINRDYYREFYEKSISNTFLSAGWSDDYASKFVLPKLDKKIIKREKKDIILITTYSQKFLYAFIHYPMSSYYRTTFFDNMKKFCSTFSKSFIEKENIYIKSYPNEYSMSRINKEVLVDIKKIKLIYNAKMSEIFIRSKLIVFDHMGTTMLETVSKNIPFIVYLDKNIESFRDEAQPFIDKMYECGVIHYSPFDASIFIEEHIDGIEEWWFSIVVQDAVNDFKNRYANIEKNWEQKLVQILNGKIKNV